MATYVLFWNPEVSSYTMERFLEDFRYEECVGNWSFHEHEKVKDGDKFYMVRCGKGKTGIVMQGVITSRCYDDEDWSPKKRRPIYYADIENCVTVNPETASLLLTPDFLSEKLPDFNWYGGHSGRVLSKEYAKKLDEIWAYYLNANPGMFHRGEVYIDSFYYLESSATARRLLRKQASKCCEICGYDHHKYFRSEDIKRMKAYVPLHCLPSDRLDRLFYAICRNCDELDDETLIEKLISLKK